MYNIEQLSLITGLTTRTLRNYLKSGLLLGSKNTGIWQFTEEQVSEFICHPSVRPSIRAKQQAVVYDFLAGQDRTDSEMCVLLDRKLEEDEAKKAADFFCSRAEGLSHFRFSYSYEAGRGHYILKGTEDEIAGIMAEFRQQE